MGQQASRGRAFVVWDTQIPKVRLNLEALASKGTDRFEVEVPGLDQMTQGEIARDIVQGGIDAAEVVLALVDLPNANVGFEIGYALAKRKRVKLGRCGDVPPWCYLPPLSNHLVQPVASISQLRAQIDSDKEVPIPGKPSEGQRTFVVCPRAGDGEAVLERMKELRPDWRPPPPLGWTLKDLHAQLAEARRVVWILLERSPEEERDGAENAAAAVVAGYAAGLGLELHVWWHRSSRAIGDVGHRALAWNSLAELETLCEGVDAPQTVAVEDVLVLYRKHLRAEHARLMPFLRHVSGKSLPDLHVDVEASWRGRGREGVLREQGSWTLRSLLEEPVSQETGCTGAWVLRGDPGAGKSTVCRHLCWQLATDEQGPLPLFVPLARWVREAGDVFDSAAEPTARHHGQAVAARTAERLRGLARGGAPVWILLDGLDEVPKEDVASLSARIEELAADPALDSCRLVVTTRPEGDQTLGQGFQRAELRKLDEPRQQDFLRRWLGERADPLWERLSGIPPLLDLARNPLMLTLLALLADDPEGLPVRRAQVYARAISLLLRRGHGEGAQGVKHDVTALKILRPLALRLHETGRETWSREELWEHLDALVAEDREGRGVARWLQTWGSAEEFLRDIGSNSGVLAPQGDDSEPWRFLHRSLRELLAGEALVELGEKEYLERGARLRDVEAEGDEAGRKEAPPLSVQHWGETFALLCGLIQEAPGRKRLLEALHRASPAILLRTLPQVEGLDPDEALGFLCDLDPGPWDGDFLLVLLDAWRLEGKRTEDLREALWRRVAPSKGSTLLLAYLHYALEESGLGVDREAFFRECGRWPEGGPALPELVWLPPSGAEAIFLMGSPEGEGHKDERPQHHVTLSPFRIACTTVTEAEYARFDPGRDEARGRLPAAGLTWWEARLYCRWLHQDGRLPTEAQWEYACRAGTTSRFWSGDSPADLARVGWFDGNSGMQVHEVGEKPANPFGLHDMHGNVWEWCWDWKGPYEDGEAVDPQGPRNGVVRVLRGGCYWDGAGGCRSACRYGSHPGLRNGLIGFRVALSPPPAGASILDA